MIDDFGTDEVGNGIQDRLRVDEIIQLIVICPKIPDQLSAVIERRSRQPVNSLPLQIFIVNPVVFSEFLNIRNKHRGTLLQILLPSAEIVIIIQILKGMNLRGHALCTPFKGIACSPAICLKNIQAVRMNEGTELFQSMIHACFKILAIVQKL